MTNQFKNPIFWSVLAFFAGAALFVWGHLRNEAIGNYKGAGALMWSGGLLAAAGIFGMFSFGNRKK